MHFAGLLGFLASAVLVLDVVVVVVDVVVLCANSKMGINFGNPIICMMGSNPDRLGELTQQCPRCQFHN